mmetsp:Transcript_7977/g.11162  ORF Transcript_7977/g.11162 Transcript_7977/m.11162 type:complete len:120 (+) Transcript_7977:592-951(+)
MAFSIGLFLFNLINGYSGQVAVESLTYSLLSVNMTTGVMLAYLLFDVHLDRKKYGSSRQAESLLPYEIGHLYSYTRTSHTAKFYAHFLTYLALGLLTGGLLFAVYYKSSAESGVLLSNG